MQAGLVDLALRDVSEAFVKRLLGVAAEIESRWLCGESYLDIWPENDRDSDAVETLMRVCEEVLTIHLRHS